MSHLLILLAAIGLDRIVGDPPWLWQRVPHPVVIFGKGIDLFEKRLNTGAFTPEGRRLNGVFTIVALLALSILFGMLLSMIFHHLGFLGMILEIIVVAVFLAQKSLGDHVQAVADGLLRNGLEGGRQAVAMIVGRDPKTLNESGVSRAAIESLSENFADGVVAPVFWYLIAGLPGILAYKMLNTADSMIGHKNERFLQFGWASARLDDLANWPAARLSAGFIAVAALLRLGAGAGRRSLSAALRDSGLHRSPNSGWPEAAMAGALDLQLAGPRVYGGIRVSEPMMHAAGRADAGPQDILSGIRVFYTACSVMAAFVVLVWLVGRIF
ncbi:adenosylcobinamide-phosphate synthase CbiB [Rhizobium rosettiformans]|uniref:adenosylcobinamide-phosphate synthase CbiB n=1 Tax=Rhizobium rosettiformans TaxID=1368430 RepID=UPI00285D560F|nr:adenosylcobinamide-phosphate synthase CbiB [Rhizobium rosettiformans]MDR7027778.1 adenosylcobinamide-phosphate synthase [Rhizobium rosettiformans]MDR7066342.1 adenosylcobinamide-phosphate synthase [Rhizobium rosettiformans]